VVDPPPVPKFKDRVFVEHAFARISQQGGKYLRTIGLARARVVIGLKVAMHNLLLMARLAHLGTGAPA